MLSFQDLDVTRSHLLLGRNPEEFRADRESLFYADCEKLLWAFCLRVIMNEFHPELVNTTSIVLFIIFINLWSNLLKFNFFDKIVQVVFQFTPVQQSSTKK